jgi:hypothetical protein
MPVSVRIDATSASRCSSKNCRAVMLTAMLKGGSPRFCHSMLCKHTVLSALPGGRPYRYPGRSLSDGSPPP